MKLMLEPTGHITRVKLRAESNSYEAQIWQGSTLSGIPTIAVVLLVTPDVPAYHPEQVLFEQELEQTVEARPGVARFPVELIL